MTKSIIIYALTILFPVIFSWVYQNKANNKIKKIITFLLIIALPVAVSTFRYNVGIDYKTYTSYYRSISYNFVNGLSMPSFIEPGYILLNIVAKIFFNNVQGVFFLTSLLFIVFSIGGIIKFKDKISMPIATLIFMTFFYSASFNAVRQLIAVSIVFFALSYAMDKKFWKYLFFILLASTIHKSALLSILFYFLVPNSKSLIKDKERGFYIFIVFFTIAIPIVTPIIEKVCLYLGLYSNYFGGEGVKNLYFLLYILPPLILVLMYKKQIIKDNYKNIFLIRLMILQIPLQYFGYYVRYFDRLSLYASISQILIMPILIKCTKKENSRILKLVTIAWFIFYYCVVYIYFNGNGVYPYEYIIGGLQ